MSTELNRLRKEYSLHTLDESSTENNPFDQFQLWFDEALESDIEEPNAMTLSTVNKDGIPSTRIVLLKGFGELGFVFYTNYQSQKGQDILANPNVCLVFWWKELQRQVRINGIADLQDRQSSEKYFHSRPVGSQLGAWASPQSRVIENREVLSEKFEAVKSKFANMDQVPIPDHWGGYVVTPNYFEFWQGRSNRMHDRIAFKLQSSTQDKWIKNRLAP